ncbi:hypothetical protein [Nitratireductor thuwali]|uniref:hypothetical protein n=1 Tax=Nitratireductor thuwali TaxID=2267699 RepID=UPI0030CF8716
MLAPIAAPKIFAPGNHALRPAFRSVRLGAGEPQAPCLHEEVISGTHVIALDYSIPGRIPGALARTRSTS